MNAQKLYRFCARIQSSESRTWRRFQVVHTSTLAQLGYVVMTLFEMKGNHRFCFDVPYQKNLINAKRGNMKKGEFAAILESMNILSEEDVNWHIELPEDIIKTPRIKDRPWIDATEIRIKTALCHAGDQMTFTYGTAEQRKVDLILEEIIISLKPYKDSPYVLAGEGDGFSSEQSYLTVHLDDTDLLRKRHEEKSTSLSETMCFDLDDMNFRAKRIPRILAETYEYGADPTQYSLTLLMRKYLNKDNQAKSLRVEGPSQTITTNVTD
ncbi:MAG: Plasmid pRiA4b ORF-3-like protein [Firmicutes bacterium ADurb.Bin182]|nr:MAG: Plasmid pRiA4b ORF-3-like protein [Firmicutes bacterium ADurb.Bin182]